jgi:hypothetical protein
MPNEELIAQKRKLRDMYLEDYNKWKDKAEKAADKAHKDTLLAAAGIYGQVEAYAMAVEAASKTRLEWLNNFKYYIDSSYAEYERLAAEVIELEKRG